MSLSISVKPRGCLHCITCLQKYRSKSAVKAHAASCGIYDGRTARPPSDQRVITPQPVHGLNALWEARRALVQRQHAQQVRLDRVQQIMDLLAEERRQRRQSGRDRRRDMHDRRDRRQAQDERGRQRQPRDSSLPRQSDYDSRRRHMRARTTSPQPRSPGLSVVIYTSEEPFAMGHVEYICAVPYGTSSEVAQSMRDNATRQLRMLAKERARLERERRRQLEAAKKAMDAEMEAKRQQMGSFLHSLGLTLDLTKV